MQELLGRGILNLDCHLLYVIQHIIGCHEFDTESLKTFIFKTVQSQLYRSLIPHLSAAARAGDDDHHMHVIDLQRVVGKFTFDNMFNVAFGIDPCLLESNANDSRYRLFLQAFDFAVEHASNRFMSRVPQVVWKLKRCFNIGNESKYKEMIETVKRFTMDVIKMKEMRIADRTNEGLLSRFMASYWKIERFGNDERREIVRDKIINFLFAGKESTSTALAWFFWLLDGHPHCKHLIRKEFLMLGVHPLNLTLDDVNNLNYLHAALSECMRLFPPVPMTSRLAEVDDVLPDGTHVKKGWFVDFSAYAMGRMERLWGSDCGEFKPERWLDGDGVFQDSDECKYLVFGGGFRRCVGKEMAYIQMKLVVVAVLHEFEIEVIGGGGTPEKMANPPYGVSTLLSLENGLHVRLKKR